MNAKIKTRWIKALRSGKYMQGQNLLHQTESGQKEHRYCCLGVLCELAVKSNIIPPPRIWRSEPSVYNYSGNTGALPFKVKYWSRLSERDAVGLAGMNDSGASFKEIARYIERRKTI